MKPPTILFGNRLIVEEYREQQGLIVVPENYKSPTAYTAVVRQLGTGKDIPVELRVGSQVLVQWNMGGQIDSNNPRMKLIGLHHIICILNYDAPAVPGRNGC